VKLRDLARAVWPRRPREFGWEIESFTLPADGEVRYARWLHPGEARKAAAELNPAPLRAFLRPGDAAIDIGAHTGDSTIPMALAVGVEGVAFALEPNAYVYKVLEVNARLNPSKTRIVPLMFAATPEDGEYDFMYTDDGYCNGGDHRAVSAFLTGRFSRLRVAGRNLVAYLSTIDRAIVDRLRYIKIDTEGFDPVVMASLTPLITAHRPYVKTEIYKHLAADAREAYYDDLRAYGYRLFKCGELTYRGDELQRADVHRWRHFDVFAVPDELA
jgi:FkbM family methyltransferase